MPQALGSIPSSKQKLEEEGKKEIWKLLACSKYKAREEKIDGKKCK